MRVVSGRGVAAELLEHGAGEDDGHHRLADDAGGGHRADVGAFVVGLDRLAGVQVHGGQRAGERGDRLEGAAHDDGLAVGHPAFEAAGAVRLPAPGAAVPPVRRQDDVVRFGAGAFGDAEAGPDLDALRGVDAHHGLGELAVQLAVPLHVRAEADRDAGRPHLEDAAERIAGFFGGVDGGDHALPGCGIGAADGVLVDGGPVRLAFDLRMDVADRCRVGVDGDAELFEKATADRTDGDARCGLAGGGALEHVAHIVEAVLHSTGEVGVAGAQTRDLLRVAVVRADLHHFLPVLPDAVGDEHGDRAAERAAVPDAAEDLRPVHLQLLAARAAVTALAPVHVGGDVVFGDLEAGGDTLEDRDERLPVRFAGREESQLCHRWASAEEAVLVCSSAGGSGGAIGSIGSGRPLALRW